MRKSSLLFLYLFFGIFFLGLITELNLILISNQQIKNEDSYFDFEDNNKDSELELLPRSLIELNLNQCRGFTDSGLKTLPENLRWLDLSCTLISYQGLKNLPRYLSTLHISGCPKINEEELELFMSKRYWLKIDCKI